MADDTIKTKQKTFTFQLSDTLKYGHEGTFYETNELELHSPCRANLKISRKIEQILMKAVMEQSIKSAPLINTNKDSSSDESSDEEDLKEAAKAMSGTIVMAAIYCQTPPVDVFFSHFRDLMGTQCCRLSDTHNMTKEIYDKLDPEDEKRLAGEYCAFFLIHSFL